MNVETGIRSFVLALAGASLLLVAAPTLAQEGDGGGDTTEAGDEDVPEATPRVSSTTPQMDAAEIAKADRDDQLSYDPRGQRDPFRPLAGGSAEPDVQHFWTEAKLTAILESPNGNIATFEGGVGKTGYFAREGDRFGNAIVHDIDYANGTVTIREQLDDPRLLKPYRDHPFSLFPAGQAPRGLNLLGGPGDDDGATGATSPLGNSKVMTSKRVPGGY